MISDYIPMPPLATGQGSDSPKVMCTRALLGGGNLMQLMVLTTLMDGEGHPGE